MLLPCTKVACELSQLERGTVPAVGCIPDYLQKSLQRIQDFIRGGDTVSSWELKFLSRFWKQSKRRMSLSLCGTLC